MKIYAIRDKELTKESTIGYLFCYEKAGEYIIELNENLDEWEAPLLFQKYVREGIFTIPKNNALLWVRERVIPSGRQNIGSILKNAKMKEYNELTLLALSKGKCSQDSCFLREISYEMLPENIRQRAHRNVFECFPTDDKNILCLFRDGLVRKISLVKLAIDFEDISHVLRNNALLRTVKVGIGGYSISFNNTIEIPVSALRSAKYEQSLCTSDFISFVCNNIIDTTKACELLQCTRQNISYLVKTGKLKPVMNGTMENLFTLGNIQQLLDE